MTKRSCILIGPGVLGISRTFTVALAAAIAIVANVLSAEDAKPVRLFILSGQSNMAGLNPDLSYTPTVTAAFADEEVIVVKSAQGGQPIRRWYKKWQPPEGRTSPSPADGALYDTLLTAVQKRLGDKRPASIVFVWMQGERDAKEKFASVYEASLTGVVQQLKDDLHCDTIGVVVGRLSDCRNNDADWLAL
ncbi:MAG: hypothetical protein KDA41_01970, partial [Planctomycetales bacterium]|nr:hypothetical protein [Planctomycetales bacterium]